MNKPRLLIALFAAALTGMMAAGCGSPAQQGEAQRRPAAQVVDDEVITTRVQAALATDPEVSPAKIMVSTKNGRVTLLGEIKSMALRKKAETIVRGVDGARSVDNQLIITG